MFHVEPTGLNVLAFGGASGGPPWGTDGLMLASDHGNWQCLVWSGTDKRGQWAEIFGMACSARKQQNNNTNNTKGNGKRQGNRSSFLQLTQGLHRSLRVVAAGTAFVTQVQVFAVPVLVEVAVEKSPAVLRASQKFGMGLSRTKKRALLYVERGEKGLDNRAHLAKRKRSR